MTGAWAAMLWAAALSAESPSQMEERAARTYERHIVDDDARDAQAQQRRAREQAAINLATAQKREQQGLEEQTQAIERHRPPRPKWGLELRLGPYRPTVAGAADVQALYRLIYVGHAGGLLRGRPIMLGLEIDGYPFASLSQLAVYGRLAYWRATGPSRLCVDAALTPVACTPQTVMQSTVGNDTAALSVVPISLGAMARANVLQHVSRVPLWLSAKLGLDYHIWWADLGNKSSLYHGHRARGATVGFSLAVGAALGLNVFGGTHLTSAASRVQNALFIEYDVVRGAALVGKNRNARLDMTDSRLVVVGLRADFS